MGDFDIVLYGKQTTDGDTARVGPETAEFLHMPHAANVCTVEAAENGQVRYVAAPDNKVVTATVATPCLLCTDAEINTPRLPSYRKKCAAEKDAATVYSQGKSDPGNSHSAREIVPVFRDHL